MRLPGGFEHGSALVPEIEFAAIDGHLELAAAEAAEARTSVVVATSHVLAHALALDRFASTWPERVAFAERLCVADRQFLVRQLAAKLGMDTLWLTGACRTCGERFDISVRQSELPVKPAGEGYPRLRTQWMGRSVTLRAPNGADQQAIATMRDADAARRVLLERLVECADPMPFAQASDAALQGLEAQIEALAPEVAEEAAAACPHCGAENRIYVDPYACLRLLGTTLFEEVHTIAVHYHWAEHAILDLPRARRQRYLELIARTDARALAAGVHA